MNIDTIDMSFYEKIVLYASGPIINIVTYKITKIYNWEIFAIINYYIAVLNIFPIIPLDGGNILKSVFEIFNNKIRASKIMILINYVFISIIIIMMFQNPNILKFSFIFIAYRGIKEEKNNILNYKIRKTYLKLIKT